MKKLWIIGWLTALLAVPAFAQSAPTASLSWNWNAADTTTYGVTGFDVQRKAEACASTALTFTPLTTTGPTALSFIDTTVAVGKVYCYRVRADAPVTALNPQGNSGFSNTAEKTIPLPTIPVPTNLLATLITALIDALQKFNTALLQGQPQ